MGYRTPITRIAVVDADNALGASLSSQLRALGYDARGYASADEFLRVLPQFAPRCLISDVEMPGMDGEQLQARLRGAGYRLPIIFLAALSSQAVRERLLDAGAYALLAKPVDPDTLAACLAAALAAAPG